MRFWTKVRSGAAVTAVVVVCGAVVVLAATDRIDGPARAQESAERTRPLLPGNPGAVPLPAEAMLVDTSRPDRVIGTGTPASCTSDAVVQAVKAGGVITFDCGPDPVTILMTQTAQVWNTSPTVVIDGGGLVTLSGGGARRILYMNTCDQSLVWITSHCQNQDQPQLTIQRMSFTQGNSTGDRREGGGGGAVFVRGGRVKVLQSRFTANRCDVADSDLGGGALRVLSQYQGLPVIVADTTFGGSPAEGNQCANGGATSSIGVTWRFYNSLFSNNKATGSGASSGSGGNGGAIYLDGNEMTLLVAGTIIRDNVAPEGGGAIFFVSNNRSGTMRIESSTLERNPSLGFETRGFPGIFYLGNGPPVVVNSTLS